MMSFNGYGASPSMWGLGSVLMFLFWGGLLLLLVLALRGKRGSRATGSDDVQGALKRRLAVGEITQDEYAKTRRVLDG